MTWAAVNADHLCLLCVSPCVVCMYSYKAGHSNLSPMVPWGWILLTLVISFCVPVTFVALSGVVLLLLLLVSSVFVTSRYVLLQICCMFQILHLESEDNSVMGYLRISTKWQPPQPWCHPLVCEVKFWSLELCILASAIFNGRNGEILSPGCPLDTPEKNA